LEAAMKKLLVGLLLVLALAGCGTTTFKCVKGVQELSGKVFVTLMDTNGRQHTLLDSDIEGYESLPTCD
jgi:hypothetical protein